MLIRRNCLSLKDFYGGLLEFWRDMMRGRLIILIIGSIITIFLHIPYVKIEVFPQQHLLRVITNFPLIAHLPIHIPPLPAPKE
jgi:hypothetical protein